MKVSQKIFARQILKSAINISGSPEVLWVIWRGGFENRPYRSLLLYGRVIISFPNQPNMIYFIPPWGVYGFPLDSPEGIGIYYITFLKAPIFSHKEKV
jgi:hypothetical protein